MSEEATPLGYQLLATSNRGEPSPNWTRTGIRPGYRIEIRKLGSKVYWYGGVPDDDEARQKPAFDCGIADTPEEAEKLADQACCDADDHAYYKHHVVNDQIVMVWREDDGSWRWTAGGNFEGRLEGLQHGHAESPSDALTQAKAHVAG